MFQWLRFSDVLNVSITASWLVLAVMLLRLLLKKAPKWIHVALWGLVALRLLLPFSIESRFSLVPSTETVHTGSVTSGGQSETAGRLDIVTNPVYDETISIELPQALSKVQKTPLDLTAIWLTGTAVMGLYAAVSCMLLLRKVRDAVQTEKGIYQSDSVPSPFVLGVVMPRIYLPNAMTEQDRTHVIAHERSHLRRKDHWWKPLGFALLAVHWFNPVMWLAYILLCRDIELACDEKVIKELGTQQRADYSQALLNCAARRTIAVCPLAFGEVGVRERVKSVLNYKKRAFWIILVAVIACIAVAVCFLTDPLKNPPQNPPPSMNGTKQLTLADVLSLSKKGNDLSFEDFAPYKCTDVGSGICIFRYEIDSNYYLDISLVPTAGNYPETAIAHFVLRHGITGKHIDIRTEDVEVFIRDQEPVDYLYYWISNDTMSFPDPAYPSRQGTVLQGSSTTGLSQRFQTIEDREPPLPVRATIPLRFADEVPWKITWKTFDPYNTSTSGSIIDPTRICTISLGKNEGLLLASNLENVPPRRVQILCQYKDRTVEYLLIISST